MAFIYNPLIPIEITFFILSKGVISLFIEDKIYLGTKEKLFNKHCVIEHGSNNLTFNDILWPKTIFNICFIKSANIPLNFSLIKGSTSNKPTSSLISVPFNITFFDNCFFWHHSSLSKKIGLGDFNIPFS